MHAKWSEKGAHEFVPKSVNYSGMGANQQSRVGQQRGPGAAYQRMAGPAMGGGWGAQSGMQMHGWGNTGGMPPEGQWGMPAVPPQPPSYVGHGAASSNISGVSAAGSYTFLAAWNLGSYTSEGLRNDLLEIDFHAERCQDLGDGSFLLTFSEPWHAKSLVVSLDGTHEHLKTQNEQPIRMATYSFDMGKWSSEDVPGVIQSQLSMNTQIDQMM
eukprot:TRINITY_DN78795_c0_g1_i1.p1 TRINITY_DN78795_c0_g1~~TRINITY_DN78795_c0_g1_i1.p1  ORF type:complete len:245 (+),score=47.23 TRINITY_DN78795_c0_g1_i1:98-736(+)